MKSTIKNNPLTLISLSVVASALMFLLLYGASRTASASKNLAAQTGRASMDRVWQEVDPVRDRSITKLRAVLRRYRMLQLDRENLGQLLRRAPLEFTEQGQHSQTVITLPTPDGSFERFSVVESTIMEPELAKKFPDIKTYLGQGIDDPTAITRFDWMPSGLHAMILSSRDTIFVEPKERDSLNYISYYKGDRAKIGPAARCLTENEDSLRSRSLGAAAANSVAPAVVAGNGATLRVYRLALAATGEYTKAVGGTLQQAMQAITTSINRIDAVFERDVAVRMVLVNNNNKIIYLPGQAEPYTDSDINACLTQNQQNLDNDAVIGKANYDIGHVFCTANSGLGALGVVCLDGQKAGGGSGGGSSPVGDSFDIDLAAQEIGHQFGLNHTFNGSTASCAGNRNADSAYEPGSGSTIGGYANTCGSQNLQAHSDDYFHVKNLEEMLAYLAASGGCATTMATGNNPPTVIAGPNFTIPKGTPFTLTATANDPDPGDNARLTYAWEEYDLGPQSPPDDDSDGMARPSFRTYRPGTNPSRTFPRMDYILQPKTSFDCGLGTNCITGETLPSIARTMNFQVTVRDNRAGGGGVASAQTTLTVDGTSGPFAVTAPQAGSAFMPGSTQTVTWNVANTNAGAVNAANVKITISTDGGATFSTSLADSTANSGTAMVMLPNATVANARIKVEALGNVFFNISPQFSIRPPCVAITVAPNAFPDGAQFMQYNQAITATGGTGALSLAVTAGTLPNGVQLANGAVTGVPQDTGTFNFTITATDPTGCSTAMAYTWKVMPGVGVGDAGTGGGGAMGLRGIRPRAAGSTMTFPVTLTAPSDQPITVQFATQDGTAIAGQNYIATSGTVTFQPGETMQVITIMILSDTPGDDCVAFDVLLSDPTGAMIDDGSGQGDIVENDPSACPQDITVGPPAIPDGQVSADYSVTFTASGGSPPIKEFDLDGGSLPPGLTLNHATGTLTGKPMASGTFDFSIAAVDNNNCLGTADFTLNIAPMPAPITAPVANGLTITTSENTAVSGTLTAKNPDGRPITFELVELRDVGHGIAAITNAGTGDFSYTPDKDFVGTDIFVFRVSDGVTEPSEGTVTVTVTGPDFSINSPSSTLTVTRGSALSIEIDIARTGGFTGPVTVTAPQLTAAGLKLRPASITTKKAKAVFKLKTKSDAATGPLQLTFAATDHPGGRTRRTTVTVNIQ